MFPRLLCFFLAIAFLCLGQSLHAAPALGENPFTQKFGGPYKENVDPQFRKDLVTLANGMRAMCSMLGNDAFKKKDDYTLFTEDIDPQVAKLDAKTDAEKKLKESALHVKTIFAFMWAAREFSEEERKSIQTFLDASALPGEKATNEAKLVGVLVRFTEYAMGLTPEEFKKLMDKAEKDKLGPLPPR